MLCTGRRIELKIDWKIGPRLVAKPINIIPPIPARAARLNGQSRWGFRSGPLGRIRPTCRWMTLATPSTSENAVTTWM